MDIESALRRHGGVARMPTLRAEGVSERAIRAALKTGELIRPRNGWVARHDADRVLVRAAATGVVITCVSQARRMDIWTLDTAPMWHVAAPTNGKLRGAVRAHIHWAAPVVPRHPDALVDLIENVLAIVAVCQPYEHALAIWESAIRRELITLAEMRRFNLGPDARRILDTAMPFSDSGLESIFIPRLRWLRVLLRQQIMISGRRVDLLIGDRLVVQIDGGHHVGPQRDADIAHDAKLKLLGYHVIRVSYMQIMNDWATVQDIIARAVAQGLHLAA
ncbi:MAG: type IV toxin-antitoxin system AbiEi family antitoxin domain-containing protein [Microbacterium sp.]